MDEIPPELMAIPVMDAPLPDAYEAAKAALTQCERIDECKDWADRADALASYARQAKDDSLCKKATKIKARAILRCGELLRAIEPDKGGRPSEKTCEGDQTGLVKPLARHEAAKEAGLSTFQKHTALRVANVPKDEFEAAVESDTPPTITELAERGKKPAPKPVIDHLNGRDEEDFYACTLLSAAINSCTDMMDKVIPDAAVRGASDNERRRMREQIREIITWFSSVLVFFRDETP